MIMVGDGAQKFAADHGIEIVSTESLVTEKSRKRLQKFQEYNPSVKLEFDETKCVLFWPRLTKTYCAPNRHQ